MSSHIKMVVFLSLGLLAVLVWHFGTVFGVFGEAPATQTEFFLRIGIIIVAFLIASAVVAAMVGSRDENAVLPDEREELIELKAERHGAIVIYLGLFCVMWLAFKPLTPMQIANAILGVMCLAEIVKIVSGLILLRRGV